MAPGGATPDRVYADYGGFAPVDPRVLAVMRPFLEGGIGNPSSPHSLGAEARESLDAARVKVGRLVGGAAAGVVFTSGATEANNLAIKGIALRGRQRAPHVVASAIEHVSVLHACREIERQGGAVTLLPVDGAGLVDPAQLASALRAETVLVSIGAANEEIGTMQPVAALARVARAAGVPVHVDGVGAVGRVPLGVDALGLDLLTVSGNDIYGPPGAGALWVRPGLDLAAQVVGGGQEMGHRSGTESVPSLVGLGVAADLMRVESAHGEPARLSGLRDRLLDGVLAGVPECRLTGSRSARVPHHVSLAVRGASAEALLNELDEAGVAASSGSSCSRLSGGPSHVLQAIGCSAAEVGCALTLTLGRWTTPAEVDAILERLPPVVAHVRAQSGTGHRHPRAE